MTIKILKNPSQEDLNVFLRQNYVVRRACYVNGEYLYFLYTKKETKKDDNLKLEIKLERYWYDKF